MHRNELLNIKFQIAMCGNSFRGIGANFEIGKPKKKKKRKERRKNGRFVGVGRGKVRRRPYPLVVYLKIGTICQF